MIDLTLFLSIAGAGVLLTLFLYFTGEKKKPETKEEDLGSFALLTYSISIVLVLYLFRLLMMIGAGLASSAYEIALVGGLCGCIPLILIGFLSYTKYMKSRGGAP